MYLSISPTSITASTPYSTVKTISEVSTSPAEVCDTPSAVFSWP